MRNLLLPSADSPVLEWLAFSAFLVVLFLCIGGFIVWVSVGRGSSTKRKRRKHHHHRPTNPTLSQTGGLPPKRDPSLPPPGP